MGVGGQHHAPATLPPGMTRYTLYQCLMTVMPIHMHDHLIWYKTQYFVPEHTPCTMLGSVFENNDTVEPRLSELRLTETLVNRNRLTCY
jgi:hypothetical protein